MLGFKKQTMVTTSTMEAENISTTKCKKKKKKKKKVLWTRNILKEQFKFNKPIKILTDNIASKTTIENSHLNSRLKHININFYFNKNHIINKKLILEYIKSKDMLADVLTENINGSKND
jgi:hypothetical protein